MTTPKKQFKLDRCLAILLATLDYFNKKNDNRVVYDGEDWQAAYYQELKVQAENYYHQGKLDRLHYRLSRFTQMLQTMADIDFASYIKTKTGYEIDIFEDLRKNVEVIIAQKEIRKENERIKISAMLNYLKKTNVATEITEPLNTLLAAYAAKNRNKNTGHTHIFSQTEKGGFVEIKAMSYTGPKLTHYEEHETVSPDGKRILKVTQHGTGKNSSTGVYLAFPKTQAEIYWTNAICSDIKASWKDNQTVVIHTKKEYPMMAKHNEIRNLDDTIKVEYVFI